MEACSERCGETSASSELERIDESNDSNGTFMGNVFVFFFLYQRVIVDVDADVDDRYLLCTL